MFSRIRRAFTLIELLCVIAIIGILAVVVAGLSPKPPQGLDGATEQARSVFSQARAQAMLGNDPDIELSENRKKATPLRFIRSRVIVLDDPADPDNTLRYMGVIVGGYRGTDASKSEKNLQESDLTWYAPNDGVMLPTGFYFVDTATAMSKQLLQSDVINKTFGPSTMSLDFPHRKGVKTGQTVNGGKLRKWYYYEFLNSGAANMTDSADKTGARFIITEGYLDPGSKQLEPSNKSVVGGFIVLRPGTTVTLNKKYDDQ